MQRLSRPVPGLDEWDKLYKPVPGKEIVLLMAFLLVLLLAECGKLGLL